MEFCHSMGQGVSLATIETREENYHLKKWLLKHGDPQTGVWLGGSSNGHHSKWSWFTTGQLIQWFDWGPSQPSGPDQHCLYIVGGFLGYQWADFHCDFEMTFLCEYKVNTGNPWKSEKTGTESVVTFHDMTETSSHLINKVDNTDVIQQTEENIKVTEIMTKVDGEDNSIEVIANSESSVIINKKDVFREKVKLEKDETSWSIFEMLKNVIKMPFRNSWNQ